MSEAFVAFRLLVTEMFECDSFFFRRSNMPQRSFQSIAELILQPSSLLNIFGAFFDRSKLLLNASEGNFSQYYCSMQSQSLLDTELSLLFGDIIRDFQFQKNYFYCLLRRSQINKVRFSWILKKLKMSSQSSTRSLILL